VKYASHRAAALAVLTAALALTVIPAWGAPQQVTLTVGVDQEVVGFDPHLVTSFSSFRRLDFLYNKLVRYNDQ
jgi:hypothetical protein